jgi:hypothetical protein
MRQAVYNISAIQDDTWNGATFTMTLNGAALTLTGSTITMKIARKNDGVVIKTLDNAANGGIVITAANVFSVSPFAPDFPVGKYDYDIQIAFADLTVKTYIKGNFCLNGDA